MKKPIHKNSKGMTLVEIILSLALIGIIITGLAPAFVFSTQQIRYNRDAITAANLANETVETIRNMDFDFIGTKKGNPVGDLEDKETKTINGQDFLVEIFINWEGELGCGSVGAGDWDYKEVRVVVTSEGYFSSGDLSLKKDISTLISRDSEQPVLTGSNLRICVFRGWGRTPTYSVPVAYTKVDIDNNMSWVYSTAKGSAMFIGLSPKIYIVGVEAPAGMILNPSSSYPKNILLETNKTIQDYAEVEYPSAVRVQFRDAKTDTPLVLNLKSQVTLTLNHTSQTDFSFTQTDSQGYVSQDAFINLWPVGTGYAGAYNFNGFDEEDPEPFSVEGYELSEEATRKSPWDSEKGQPWDGTFEGPNTTKTVYIYLQEIEPEQPEQPGELGEPGEPGEPGESEEP